MSVRLSVTEVHWRIIANLARSANLPHRPWQTPIKVEKSPIRITHVVTLSVATARAEVAASWQPECDQNGSEAGAEWTGASTARRGARNEGQRQRHVRVLLHPHRRHVDRPACLYRRVPDGRHSLVWQVGALPFVVLWIAPFPEQPLGYNQRTTSGFISHNFFYFITTFSLQRAIRFASGSRLRPCRTKSRYLNCYSLHCYSASRQTG